MTGLSLKDYQNKKLRPSIDDTPGASFLALLKSHKISADEYKEIRSILKRAPTIAELGVFSAMWSEHCSYKSSRIHLKRLPTKGPQVVVGPGENAGVVRVSGKFCVAFKMESHNHPSYIEPYHGAATGVGGILRDVFCMGARPFANLNSLRFGDPKHPRTSFIVKNAVKGIGHYGNCVGVPTVGGSLSFGSSYNGNCLVNAMTLGAIHEDRIFKGFATGTGNLVVYVGSATGRDGVHGATMASDQFDGTNQSKTTIQVGDPFKEKLLLEATLEVLDRGLVIGLQDMGAAGLTSSAFEMAGRAGNGLLLDLSKVPVRTEALTAYELLLSESQERMLMVIKPECWEPLKEVLDRWLLDSEVIGLVTSTGRVQIYHEGQLEADIPVAPITDKAPQYSRPITPRSSDKGPSLSERELADISSTIHHKVQAFGLGSFLKELLSYPGDYTPIHRQYDKHILNKTVHGPESQGAAVLWIKSDYADPSEPWFGVATATGCNEEYCRVDPYLGAAHAVLKTARMIAASGGHGLAITDCLNYGNPENPEVMWEISQGIDGISLACEKLSIPVVSGNVSLYNETNGQSIAPTPMIGMVGKVLDIRKSPPGIFSETGEIFCLFPKSVDFAWGGSLTAKALGMTTSGPIPQIDWDAERESLKLFEELALGSCLSACRDFGQGGFLVGIAKMFLNPNPAQRFDVQIDSTPFSQRLGGGRGYDAVLQAFGECAGAYFFVLKDGKKSLFTAYLSQLQHNQIFSIGQVKKCQGASPELRFKNIDGQDFSWTSETLLAALRAKNDIIFGVN